MEADISPDILAIVEANGGVVQRFDTRLKDVDSLYRKIQDMMAERGLDAELAAEDIHDALRYTAVLDEHGYWARGTALDHAVEEAGYRHEEHALGWRTVGYRGRNETFSKPDNKFEFEVQIHTEASLAAAEATHPLYEQMRLWSTPDEEKARLKQEQDVIFAQVPLPDDVQWLD